MFTHSLKNLLEQMSVRSICGGWGAIAAIGRSQLNRVLEEQHLARLGEARFLPALSGEVFVGADRSESVKLDSIRFGKPELSFEKASLNSSRITLSMNIIAGIYTRMSLPVNAAPSLMSRFSIREAHGFKVEMQLVMGQFSGDVDSWNRVTIDLGAGENLTTTLGGEPGVQQAIAPLIQAHLARQTKDKRQFELSLVDLGGYHAFAPVEVYFRTQRAPGAGDASSPNFGDGCLTLFMRLRIRNEDGLFPGEGDGFPYLIPNDQAQGRNLYTASLVVNEGWADLVDADQRLELVDNIRFAAANVFKESNDGRHRPHDLLVLGNVVPAVDHLSIKPGFVSLDDSRPQRFQAFGSTGNEVGVTWSVSNPQHPMIVGTISASGEYSPPEKSSLYQAQVPLTVTARHVKNGRESVSCASVLSLYESMSCCPHILVTTAGRTDPVLLNVATTADEILEWPTLDPSEGVLERIDNNCARYTPPATQTESLQVRRIKVKSWKEETEAVVVLLKEPQTLAVTPPFVPLGRCKPVSLKAGEFMPEDCRWSVIGEGTVSRDGIFTPPEGATSLVSVVKCDIVYDGVGPVRRTGFSIIHLQQWQEPSAPEIPEEPTWEEINLFTIKALGDPKVDRCYHNGFQQIPVLVTIGTASIRHNGENIYIPVSDLELSTLQLVTSEGNIVVPFIPEGQEGIEYGSNKKWAVSKAKNRFREFSASPLATTDAPLLPAPALAPQDKGIRQVRLYIHLAEEGTRSFYARFRSDKGTYNSNDDHAEDYEVTVHGIRIPSLSKDHYKFERERVWQDAGGHDQTTQPGEPFYPDVDVFSYYRQTTDYWRLNYFRAGSYRIGFATLKFEQNTTTIQWESELLDEVFGSYTGHAFNPARRGDTDTPPDRLEFDSSLILWRKQTSNWEPVRLDKPVSPGELVISLHRRDDMNYWYDGLADNKYQFYRKMLDPGLKITLMDEEGNLHKLDVAFPNSSIEFSRNKLDLTPI